MSEKNIAMYVLSQKVGEKLTYPSLVPTSIFNIMVDFVGKGCKSRSEYELLVNFVLHDNFEHREILLNS